MSGLNPTKVPWADVVYNPVTGCTPISPGCKNCFAKNQARRFVGRFGYPDEDPFQPVFHEDRLNAPLFHTSPAIVFSPSMGDLFHPAFPYKTVKKILDVMRKAHWLRFMVLTKRVNEMSSIMNKYYTNNDLISNVWLGATIESQDYMWRAHKLIEIPATDRFIDASPLLGPIILPRQIVGKVGKIISTSETGRGRRDSKREWFLMIRDFCNASGIPGDLTMTISDNETVSL
jgi:protein gp37